MSYTSTYSPNTAGLRAFHEPEALAGLLDRVGDRRAKPLFVKLPALAEGESPDRLLALAGACVEHGAEGLTVANTRPTEEPRLASGVGGLSGKPIFPEMLRLVSAVRAEVGEGIAINASGGIFTGEDTWRALQAGATTVQLLTGLVYRGPTIAKGVNRELRRIMDREGVASLGR